MRTWILLFLLILAPGLSASQKVYVCKYEENVPYGVMAWHQSERVQKGIGKENRFEPYDAKQAEALAADALIDRSGGNAGAVDPRETAFWQAYNEKGWSIYIESREPQVEELLNDLLNPRSAGNNESYEVFFAPGLERVPYYQIYVTQYQNKATFYDWGTPHGGYRSLKGQTYVESLPLKDGVGTFIFIPWHLLYEHAPLDGGEWRFTVIRWMPFSKSGGVTWGGQVHETGRFGRVVFEKPKAEQRQAIETRLRQYGWYKFKAESDQLKERWSDPHLGDPAFCNAVLVPEIDRITGEGMEKADLRDLMEFGYKAEALRTRYLIQKRFSRQ